MATCHGADLPHLRIADIYEQMPHPTNIFVVEGTVTSSESPHPSLRFSIRDDSGGIAVRTFSKASHSNGDRVRIIGHVDHVEAGIPWIEADRIESVARGQPVKPTHTDVAGILRGDCNFMTVILEGVIIDVFPDDIDTGWTWLALESSGNKVMIAVPTSSDDRERLEHLVDAKVSLTGFAGPDIGYRRFIRPYVCLKSLNSISILEPPSKDPFAVEEFRYRAPDPTKSLAQFPHRRRISGKLIASWRGKYLFVRVGRHKNVLVRCGKSCEIPAPGTSVTAVGFVNQNTFYARLDNAILRKDSDPSGALDVPEVISPRETLSGGDTNTVINPDLNGRVVRVIGFAREATRKGTAEARMELDCDGYIVPIEIGHFAAPEPGTRTEVAGAFIMETESEYEGLGFSRIKGFSIAPRFQADIRVLAAPPWWTPAKLSTLVGALLVVLAALVWRNKHKERQTVRESQLRIDERTKLAVELHDSLAQNLTGISLQLDAAEMAEGEDRAVALTHLGNAREALRSCREGLRYCLSDLRSRSFEDTDMTEAVTETVRPHIGKTKLFVRFNVPRARLSDTTAHAVLCIVRELAVNAVRHGHATDIHVAGEFRDGQIRFSVRDNGCGFDPDSRPGSAQGHFGLLGITERVSNFKGSLKLDSATGKGTKATVILNIT